MRLVLVTLKSSYCDVVCLKPYVVFLLLVLAITFHTKIIKATFAYVVYLAERHHHPKPNPMGFLSREPVPGPAHKQ